MAHAYKSMQHEASIERVMMRSTKDNLGTAEKRGCGSAGRVVASEPRGLQFESIHRQKIIMKNIFTVVNC